ncbi:somatomedin-B and thrombospondin type-1 domain-containing protein [Lingula anatina]|uniref:Somatomedin-B and thrombospondin type-1 domain-containing protein n=1 Tax=Lingula anatina TaxID=7574 RepID=A0A1S3HMR4_LINAN|nr:somatomedin-B and thrombospondin type-1 domain-containing protein [Lingula anatina]|eukprot:XP_013387358.1 somatomedin-B and thrombospondin type-1 domain-containing protein [Lingula anatina]
MALLLLQLCTVLKRHLLDRKSHLPGSSSGVSERFSPSGLEIVISIHWPLAVQTLNSQKGMVYEASQSEDSIERTPTGPQYCYCDEGCHATKDCCRDREESCGGAVDCVVSKWAGWGQCSRLCDSGVQERYRNITKPPRNGGKLCPPLKQERVCFGNKCKHTRDFRKQEARVAVHPELEKLEKIEEETGRIIPAAFGTWRKSKVYDFSKDIRKNLYYKYYYANAITRTSYYATYEIVSSRRVCQKSNITPWAKVLEKGAQICVECQPTAMWKSLGTRCKGHGVINQITRWNAVNARGCHGKWIMRTVHKEGRCDEGTRKDFIFI